MVRRTMDVDIIGADAPPPPAAPAFEAEGGAAAAQRLGDDVVNLPELLGAAAAAGGEALAAANEALGAAATGAVGAAMRSSMAVTLRKYQFELLSLLYLLGLVTSGLTFLFLLLRAIFVTPSAGDAGLTRGAPGRERSPNGKKRE